MTHVALAVVAAFLATPLAASGEREDPGKGADLPLVFVLFCALCAALAIAEALWPPVGAVVSTMNMVVAQL